MRQLRSWLGMFGVLAAVSAHADVKQMPWESAPPPRLIEDRFRLDVGLWDTSIETQLRADATPQQPGTTLSGENDIGLTKHQSMPNFELTLLPGKRHLIRINAFNSRRDGQAILNSTVSFDGNTYTAGSLVKSTLNLNLLGVGYGYRLLKTERYEVAADISVQIASVETNVYVPSQNIRQADSYVVPLPLVGLEGRWEVIPKWNLLGRYQWLGGSSSDIKGAIRDWRVGVQWQFSQHVGVGLHYRGFGINVESSGGSHPGEVDLKYRGAQLEFRASL